MFTSTAHNKSNHEHEKYERMNKESWHRFFDDEEFRGINLKGITGAFDMKKGMFLCDNCNCNNMEKFLNMKVAIK